MPESLLGLIMILKKLISPRKIMKFMRFYPPYLGGGIYVEEVNDDFNELKISMKQTVLNTNYVGTHFGGSLYSMCDPFYMFILLHHLGKDYIVWDKAAEIKFIKPGKGKVSAVFRIELDDIEKLKNQANEQDKVEPIFETYVTNEAGENIAYLKKRLYIKKKDQL